MIERIERASEGNGEKEGERERLFLFDGLQIAKYLHKIAINFWHYFIGVPLSTNVSNVDCFNRPRPRRCKIPERAICIAPTNEALTSCAHRCLTLGWICAACHSEIDVPDRRKLHLPHP